jgi:hypothetical protein
MVQYSMDIGSTFAEISTNYGHPGLSGESLCMKGYRRHVPPSGNCLPGQKSD